MFANATVAADNQVVDLADEVSEHRQLGRNLCTADHRGDRALWIA